MSVSIEQCQKQEKSRLAACRQSWIFLVLIGRKPERQEDAKQLPACTEELDRDRAKAREREGALQLPACTAELDRDRAEAESRKVEKKKRKQVITCE